MRALRLALVLAAAAGCGVAPLPRSLAGVPLVELETGRPARDLVARLHGPGAGVPGRTVVGRYAAPGREIVVYASTFPSPEEAAGAFGRMVAAIGRGGGPFRIQRREAAAARLRGLGRQHVVWVEGARLVWVEATAGLAGPAARELGLSPG